MQSSSIFQPRAIVLGLVFMLLGAAIAAPFAVSFAQDGENGPLAAAGNAFSYQGRLESGGVPANGSYDFRFTLYSDAVANTTVGSVLTQTRTVTNGLFTAEFDFGVGAFNGQERWIGVEAKQGANAYVALAPRTKLNATPYALYALNYPSHDHFGDSWSGFAPNGLSIMNSSTDGTSLNITANGVASTAVLATNNGNCQVAPQTCYGVWGIATLSEFGSGFGGVGVRGDGSNTGVLGTGPQYGVYGSTPDGIAVQAYTEDGTGLRAISGGDGYDSAIDAQATTNAYGVRVTAVNGIGLSVTSANNTGILAAGSIEGVYALSTSPNGVGVRGIGNKVGVFGSLDAANLPSGNWAGYFAGNVLATGYFQGTVFVPSDARLKSNVEDLPHGLEQIMNIRPVSYALNSDPDSKEHLGVIAQEVELVLPGVVNHPDDDPEGMLAVNYIELIPVLIKAIQEQQAQIEALQSPAGQHITASLETNGDSITREEFEAELAAVRAESGKSELPWLPIAVAAVGLLGAGFAFGRRK